ncbi:alpha-amylase family glycosyl hydrolase [uncultured Clostridium sp.]|uniref:alpha-amylase family glycosyl hydrolase n=1 Tax=uncultured Clostridium sp. TaxID=59620 RepID=UPI00262812E4|nr:alpha-amylase family glycosyl hydrolase [uncultured Clostridium sp.]
MRKKLNKLMGVLLTTILLIGIVGCGSENGKVSKEDYNGRVFYEIFVRAFNDSNGDGIGDINGVTEKLDYLQDLGIGGIWLMPINSSPSYHGYDVIDYKEINKEYGTMDDFKNLLEEAHKRDIKIYIDMVINHSSSENMWFKEASEGKENRYRDYYIWTDDKKEASMMSPMGTMPWAKVNKNDDEFYYGIFWSGMPDLNLDNEKVKTELKDIAKFYIDMGVDGFRMDAVKWFHNEAEENNRFIEEYSEYCKSLNEDFKLVGEVWDSAFSMAQYQNSLDSFFDFSLGEKITKGLLGENIEKLPESIKYNYELYTEENPEFIVAPFLSNHDQNRIMNTLGSSEKKMKMAASIYLTLPGTPYIYYGEEVGMKGIKPDEDIREPFIWDNKDLSKNTKWRKSTNDLDKIALNAQKEDEDSLYNFYKEIINVRNNNSSLQFGDIEKIESGKSEIMIMKRSYEKETSYVIINSKDKDTEVKLEKGKYKVLFSSERDEDEIKVKEEINLKGGEIIILKK